MKYLSILAFLLTACGGSSGGGGKAGTPHSSDRFGSEGQWPLTYLCHQGGNSSKVRACVRHPENVQKAIVTIEHLSVGGSGTWYASIFETKSFRDWTGLTKEEAACLEKQFCDMGNPI